MKNGSLIRTMALFIVLLMIGGGLTMYISNAVKEQGVSSARVERLEDNTVEEPEGSRADPKGVIYALQAKGCRGTSEFMMYDVGTNTWKKMASFPGRVRARQVNNKMAYDGKDTIYAIRQDNSADWYKYSISGNKWTKMSPNLPTSAYYSPGICYGEVGNNHYIYYHRGYRSTNFYRYDIDQGTWSSMAGQYIYYYGMSIVFAKGYVFTNYGYRNYDFYRYDCANNRWSRMSNLPYCYYRGPTFTYDGGDNLWYQCRNTMYRYNINNNNWYSGYRSMPTGMCTGRDICCDEAGEYIYGIPGGGEWRNSNQFFRYDISGNSWTSLASVSSYWKSASSMIFVDRPAASEYGGGHVKLDLSPSTWGYMQWYRYYRYGSLRSNYYWGLYTNSLYIYKYWYDRGYYAYEYYYRSLAKWDTSMIPDDITVTECTLKMSCNYHYCYSGCPDAYVVEMDRDPDQYSGSTLYNYIDDGTCIDSGWQWRQGTLTKDLSSRMNEIRSNGWYALGFRLNNENRPPSRRQVYAYCQQEPKITIEYLAPTFYKETFGSKFEDSPFGVAWSNYTSDPLSARNQRVDTADDNFQEGFTAYDETEVCWRMDAGRTRGPNLNELILHLGMIDVESLTVQFATCEFGSFNQDIMPDEFDGHVNADGVAVSDDGLHWYKLWQYPSNLASWTMVSPLDILALCPNLEMDPKEDFYIKFQQYGSGGIPVDGILWDEIYLEANDGSAVAAEFWFSLPRIEIEYELDNDVIFATDQYGKDEDKEEGLTDTAELTLKVIGKGGSANYGTGYIYTQTQCGSSGMVIYDSVNDAWSEGATIPRRCRSYNNNKMAYDGDDTIYVIPQYSSNYFYKYSISNDQMTQLPGLPYNPSYYGVGLAYVEFDNHHYVYYHPGYYRSTLYRYDIDNNRWDSCASQSVYRYATSMVSAGEYLFMNYGRGNYNFYRYDCRNNRWSNMRQLPYYSYYGASFTYDGDDTIWYEQGYNNYNIYTYSISQNTWSSAVTTFPTRVCRGCDLYHDGMGKIYAIGGSRESAKNLYMYDIEADEWTTISSCTISLSRQRGGWHYGSSMVMKPPTGGDNAGEDVQFKFDAHPDITIIDEAGDAVIDGYTYSWSLGDIPIGMTVEYPIILSSHVAFNDSLGTNFSLTYGSWDGDLIDWYTFDVDAQLKVRAAQDHEIVWDDGERGEKTTEPIWIIANRTEGTTMLANSYDQEGQLMPEQELYWTVIMDHPTRYRCPDCRHPVPIGQEDATHCDHCDADFAAPQQTWVAQIPAPSVDWNEATIIANEYMVREGGRLYLVHNAPGGVDTDIRVYVTWGIPDHIKTILFEPYIVGEKGIITATVYDAYGNVVEDYAGSMRMVIRKGEVDVEYGNVYNFTDKDRGTHTSIITPKTWGPNSTTLYFEDRDVGIVSEADTFDVIAGPVRTLDVQLDWARMGWDNPNSGYHAGDPIYLVILGRDGSETRNPSETYNKPVMVSHDVAGYGDYEPEPWNTVEGNFILRDWLSEQGEHMGITAYFMHLRNSDDEAIRLYKAGTVTLTLKSTVDHSITGTITIDVLPTYLDNIVAMPGGSEANPEKVEVILAGSQRFEIKGYDRYENEVTIDPALIDWSVDSNINKIGRGTFMENAPVFNAVEYFAGPYQEGQIHVEATGPRDATARLNITIRVVNDKDVWLEEEDIQPESVLVGQPLKLQANIHYHVPAQARVGNLLEIKIRFSLVEKNPDGTFSPIVELVEKNVKLTNLNNKPEGIWIFNTTLPSESFSDFVNMDKDNNPIKNVNYMKVEILDAVGGADMSEFEITDENNQVTVKLYAVVAGKGGVSPSFAPSIMAVGIALLALAIGSTFYSGRRKKRYGKDKDAVSPVIAIILMVAITIVLAGVLWLWVSGLVATGKDDPLYKGFSTEWGGRTENKDYELHIKTVDTKNVLSVEDIRFTLYSPDRQDMSNGQHKATNVYGKPIDDQTFISFRDGDHDGMLSIGDRFIIKSTDHVDDDGSTDSPGLAEAGFFFEVRAGSAKIFEEQIN